MQFRIIYPGMRDAIMGALALVREECVVSNAFKDLVHFDDGFLMASSISFAEIFKRSVSSFP